MNEKKKDEPRSKAPSKDEQEMKSDPQESMRGPVSSLVQKVKLGAEHNDEKEEEKHELKKNQTGGDFIHE